jgi:hypothetical protein
LSERQIRGRVTILDEFRLEELAEFDGRYLNRL